MDLVFIASTSNEYCARLLTELRAQGALVCPIRTGVLAPEDAIAFFIDPELSDGFRVLPDPIPLADRSIVPSWALLTQRRVAVSASMGDVALGDMARALRQHHWREAA